MISKEQIIIDNEKNNKILSLMEEIENLQLNYQEQSEENDNLNKKILELNSIISIYWKEFWKLIICSCDEDNSINWVPPNNDCILCKGKWFYFDNK